MLRTCFCLRTPHRVDEVNGQGQGAAGPVYRCGVSMNWSGVQPLLVAYYTMRVTIYLNGGTPKWMVYKGKLIYKWMIWGYPHFSNPHMGLCYPIYWGLWTFVNTAYLGVKLGWNPYEPVWKRLAPNSNGLSAIMIFPYFPHSMVIYWVGDVGATWQEYGDWTAQNEDTTPKFGEVVLNTEHDQCWLFGSVEFWPIEKGNGSLILRFF